MAERSDSFTLYLRGGDGAALREVIRPFGNGGDLERWRLDAWDAEVILGRAAEVALIRVPQSVDIESAKNLIRELHQAALDGGLVLSDDVHSHKSPDELMHAFGLEGERATAMHAGKPSARWGLTKTIVFWAVAAGLLMVAYYVFEFARDTAHQLIEGR